MSFSNPLLSALLGAVLGYMVMWTWFWHHPSEHRGWSWFVVIGCAVLGFAYGEPFVDSLLKAL